MKEGPLLIYIRNSCMCMILFDSNQIISIDKKERNSFFSYVCNMISIVCIYFVKRTRGSTRKFWDRLVAETFPINSPFVFPIQSFIQIHQIGGLYIRNKIEYTYKCYHFKIAVLVCSVKGLALHVRKLSLLEPST